MKRGKVIRASFLAQLCVAAACAAFAAPDSYKNVGAPGASGSPRTTTRHPSSASAGRFTNPPSTRLFSELFRSLSRRPAGAEIFIDDSPGGGSFEPAALSFKAEGIVSENIFEDFDFLRILFSPGVAVPLLLVLSAAFLMRRLFGNALIISSLTAVVSAYAAFCAFCVF